MTDLINHPKHYQFPEDCKEMADITISLPHARASAMEYIFRAGSKPGVGSVDDLRKAIWWLEREIERLMS